MKQMDSSTFWARRRRRWLPHSEITVAVKTLDQYVSSEIASPCVFAKEDIMSRVTKRANQDNY
jgi:hypothetical protein